jgi:saccharopine dehydrogenase (NAD+, L-lysine forming)
MPATDMRLQTVPLKHVHVQFAHCYKGQGGWETVLARFPRGGGTLLDLEFLQDPKSKRRVAAFGYSAGFSGSALALKNWAWQLTHPNEPLPSVESYPNEDALVQDIKNDLAEGQKQAGRLPKVIVIGALGRCGRGAVDMALKAGVPESQILKWDMAETAKGGPFDEILESDIFVNCIYLNEKIPHFVNLESLKKPGRKLRVVCDVSADTTNPNNPGKSSLSISSRLILLANTMTSTHLHRCHNIQQSHCACRRSIGSTCERD